jgi:hypothetical protein
MLGRLAIIVAVLGLVAAAPAVAARGVAVDIGRIEMTDDLTPGGSYRLPTLGVRNPGDEPARYRLGATAVVDPERRDVPEAWFEFKPHKLTLKPGETQPVRMRLVVPTDAEPGNYVALVGAELVGEGDGAQVGAAAAARTTFTVESATALESWWLRLETFLGDHTPWTWLMPGTLGFALVALQARRRLSFTVARRA